MEEYKKEMLMVSAILFKNNVPVEEAKLIGAFIEKLIKENQQLKEQLEVGKEQYNDVVEEKEKYKETVDKAIHLLEQFDAWLEPQDFLKIKKIEKVLEEVE